MKVRLSAVALCLLAPCLAHGQEQLSAVQKPGPEVQKLSYYIGTWEGHGEAKSGALGSGGKLSSKMTCDWFPGGFQVVCRGEETGPTGTRNFLNILGYDEKARSYTEFAISSRGDSEYDHGGRLSGNTLTYLIDQAEGGKLFKFRYTEVHVAPALQTYRAEASLDGAHWSVLGEGKIQKVK